MLCAGGCLCGGYGPAWCSGLKWNLLEWADCLEVDKVTADLGIPVDVAERGDVYFANELHVSGVLLVVNGER